MSKIMVVLSGGQDSTTCLIWAKALYDEVHAITFDYGQRHAVEIEAARKVANIVGVASHTTVNVAGTLLSMSPLTSTTPLETYSDYESMDKTIGDRVELTFVPLRNPLFLTIAANHALARGCEGIVTGVCAMDNANYPDCTQEFIGTMLNMILEALGQYRNDFRGEKFKILAPLLDKTKAGTVQMAYRMAIAMGDKTLADRALAYSHTCYAGEVPPCGKCHACVLRAKGFEDAGVADPLVERFRKDNGVMSMWPEGQDDGSRAPHPTEFGGSDDAETLEHRDASA